jgi:hypothetical protein
MEEDLVTDFDPTTLGEGSRVSASSLLGLNELPPTTTRMNNRRPRGRPLGSTNKPKDEEPKPVSHVDKAKEEKAKKERIDKLAQSITDGLNEQLMNFLMSQGVPSSVLYKNNLAPIKQESIYTNLGERISVQPLQANAVASFLVALDENTSSNDTIEKLTSGTTGLILKGGFALITVGVYFRNVAKAWEQMQPMLKMKRVYEEQRKKAQFGQTADQSYVMQ